MRSLKKTAHDGADRQTDRRSDRQTWQLKETLNLSTDADRITDPIFCAVEGPWKCCGSAVEVKTANSQQPEPGPQRTHHLCQFLYLTMIKNTFPNFYFSFPNHAYFSWPNRLSGSHASCAFRITFLTCLNFPNFPNFTLLIVKGPVLKSFMRQVAIIEDHDVL